MSSSRKSLSADVPRSAAFAVAAGVALLAGLAVALAAGSFASYGTVKRHLDQFASDGDAGLTPGDFDALVLRFRLAAAAAVVLAAGAFAARRQLGVALAGLAASAGAAAGDAVRGTRRAVALESRLHLGALGLVTALGLGVRLAFLFQPMRYDESVTYVHYASRPWYIALTTYTAPNNHVFHSLLVHLSTLLFGGAPWAIRLPALVAGVLLVPATYVGARALYGRDVALLAGALVAGSSVLVEYSTNARGYTIVALVFVLLLALAVRLRTSRSPAEWLAFSVLGALAFFTVPTTLYAFGAVVVWLAWSIAREGERSLLLGRLLPSVAATGILSALLYLPLVAASGLDSLLHNDFVRPVSWSDVADELPGSLVDAVEGWHRDVPWPLALLLGVAFAAGLVLHRRVARVGVPPVLAALAWIAPVLVVQRVVPFERVWTFLVPLYLATAAAGIVLVLRPLGRTVAVTACLSVAIAASLAGAAVATDSVSESEDTSTFRDGRPVAALLAADLRPGDKLLVAPPADAILEYHLLRLGLDAGGLLYWREPGGTRRFLVVVKEGPRDYPLATVLSDPRLDGVRLGPPRVVRRFDEATVYEADRAHT